MKNEKRPLRAGISLLLFLGLIVGTAAACLAAAPALQPLSLEQALKIARDNNLQRRLAQSDLQVARDKTAQSTAAYGPNLTLSGGAYHYNDQPSEIKLAQSLADLNNGLSGLTGLPVQTGPDDGLNYYGLKIHLEQPLYTGNKLNATHKQAQANQANAQSNLAATDNDLVFQVKQAYYTTVYCQDVKKTMDEAVTSMARHLEEANAYYKVGAVPKLDVLRAEVKLADLQQKQVLAENNLNLAQSALNNVLGIDLNTRFSLDEPLKYGPLAPDLATCQSQALINRPELAAQKAKVEMARQAVTISQSGTKPMVAFVVDGQHTEPNNASPSLQYGIVATMKLYDSGMVKNQVAEAQDTLQKAQTGQELLERGIKLEVEQAYRNVQAALKTIDVAAKSMAQAQETEKMAAARYQAGLSTSLERIDAEVGLTQTQTNYTQALSMYNIALAQLDRAIGGQSQASQ